MILNAQQQRNLWDMANNRGGGAVVNMPVTIENNASDAVNALPILENVDYFKSSMYTASPLSNYYDKSGAFIRKYMKGSTYCDKINATKCFADRYYK